MAETTGQGIKQHGNLLSRTAPPHLHKKGETVSKAMRNVLLALVPAAIWAVIVFGFNVVYIISVSIAVALLSELVMRKVLGRKPTLRDLSAVVTGLIFAFLLPPTTPLWLVAIGSFIAVAVFKELFGGLGKNIINPAVGARVVLYFLPLAIYGQRFVKPFFWKSAGFFTPVTTSINNGVTSFKTIVGGNVDVVAAATPMSLIKSGRLLAPDALSGATPIAATYVDPSGKPNFISIFFGLKGGSIGEISVLLLLLGGIFLIYKRTIDWRIPVGIIGTYFVLSLVTWFYPSYALFGGGLWLGAFFMATDWVTSPMTRRGKWIYAVGIGATIFIFRFWYPRPEGVVLAIFAWNIVTLAIDRYIAVPKFGEAKAGTFNKLPVSPRPAAATANKARSSTRVAWK
jgi:electron transport complex protein RnfD